jgi:hypothetical protein
MQAWFVVDVGKSYHRQGRIEAGKARHEDSLG